jgi:hypothetical protein
MRNTTPSHSKGWLIGNCLVLGVAIVLAIATSGTAEAGKGLANGVACTLSSDCASGNCTFKVCKAKGGGAKNLGNGASCNLSSECASGNCTFHVCKSKGGGKKLGNGMACRLGSDCESGNCTFKVCKKK